MKVRCGDANHILERPHELDSGELISGKIEGKNSWWKLQKQLMKAMQKKKQLNGLSLSAFRGVPLALWISMPGSETTTRFPENWILRCKIGHFDKFWQINLDAMFWFAYASTPPLPRMGWRYSRRTEWSKTLSLKNRHGAQNWFQLNWHLDTPPCASTFFRLQVAKRSDGKELSAQRHLLHHLFSKECHGGSRCFP